MGFVNRELARIEAAIAVEPNGTVRFKQLFSAQQALAWATDPNSCYASPLDSIDGRVGMLPLKEPDALTVSGPR